MQKNWQDLLNFMRFVVKRFKQDRCTQIAASLTFTTLLSIVPLITIALTVFSAFPVFDDFSREIRTFLMNNLMPEKSGGVIARYMQQFAESATRLTALGIVFLTVTAMLMMLTIDKAFNVIWRVSRPRPLLKRLIVYWAVLTLSPLLVGASLSLTSWLVGLSLGYAKHIPILGVGVLKVLPVLFTTLAFAMLFRLVPNRYVPRAHAWIGAVVSAAAFESMNRIFGYYVGHFPTYKLVYGAFSSVPIFLLWIYLSWLVVLLGAVIAASLSHWRTPVMRDTSGLAQTLNALRILKCLIQGLESGQVHTLPTLSKALLLGYEPLEKILEKLASVDMVRKAQGEGWMLMRDTSHIKAVELLQLFLLDRNALAKVSDAEPLQAWLANCVGQLERSADVSLQELFVRSEA